jgi:hypothetical protein
MKSGCSASSFSGGQSALAPWTSSCHQWSRPGCIATGWPVRRTTTTCSTQPTPFSASSTAGFSAKGAPRRCPPSAVTTTLAPASSMRSRSDSAEKPPNTTLWVAPIRVQARSAIGSSGIIGM